MKSICVFCGSRKGSNEAYALAARELGKMFAERNITLVYGGGNVGLMGEIARAVMENNGNVIGVIPTELVARESALLEVSDLRIVNSMHERKTIMSDLADGFIALPGGIGTFEEFFEIWTWAQLGIHAKPIALLNVNNYYGHLIDFLANARDEDFISDISRSIIIIEKDAEIILEKMNNYTAPAVTKWLNKKES